MNRYEFETLRFIEKNGKKEYSLLSLSNALCVSKGKIEESIDGLIARGLLVKENNDLLVPEKGIDALEPYRVKRAVIVGAGMGTRLMPATKNRPKPMVFVNGKRIIDTLIDALVAAEITDIVVVGGYRFDVMKELHEQYPFIRLLENKRYAEENNISSALLAKEYFCGGCYFCEADVYVSNPAIIEKYQYATNILGSWSMETDDWCFKSNNGVLCDYKKGGTYCYNYYGISYWTDEDSVKLIADWEELYSAPGGRDLFWEFPAFIIRKEKYNVEIIPCKKEDVIEIDNYSELCLIDSSYLLFD